MNDVIIIGGGAAGLTAALPPAVPLLPEAEASAGEAAFMCQTPIYPADVQTAVEEAAGRVLVEDGA